MPILGAQYSPVGSSFLHISVPQNVSINLLESPKVVASNLYMQNGSYLHLCGPVLFAAIIIHILQSKQVHEADEGTV